MSKPYTLTDIAEEKLIDYIRENNLKPGDQLPFEAELVEEIDVGRNILREGLSRLRMLGIVESRRKRGICVTKPDAFKGFGRVLRSGLLQDDSFGALMELRLMLEIGIAPYITTRATPEGLDRLRELYLNEEQAKNALVKLEYEIEFHKQIYRMVGNPLLEELQELLLPFFQKIIQNPPKTRSRKSDRASHRELFEAIEQGDSMLYVERVMSHLKLYL